MNSILDNSIWPNLNGELGSITTPIPDGVTVKWPDGDALVGNFVYKDGKLVGFVDSKALIPNDTKSSNLPYDCVHTSFERILDGDFTFDGTRKNHFEIKCSDLVNFAKINLSEILSDVKFVIDLDDSSENKLVVHTDRVDESKLEEVSTTLSNVLPVNIEVAQYNHNIEISWRDINKYAACVTKADMWAVNPDYANDLTSDGEWVYLLSSFNGNSWHDGLFFQNYKIKKINIELPAMRHGDAMFYGAGNMIECIVRCPAATSLIDFTISCRNLTFLEIYAPNVVSVKWGFGHSSNPSMKLSHFRFLAPTKISDATRAWENTILDKDSVLNIVENIPAWSSGTHQLDLGIHVDYQNDEAVAAAISEAETKGWTVTVKWNGTPTAATASTFGFGQLIYAKVGEMEMHDGTTEKYLDWGHYVTDETGYETFRSLESAYEYFGLEMPFIGD